jgi:hypothetical protein
MKTKTLFLTLFAGAFLCFSNASYGQYHSSSSHSSSSSSSGSGDGAFDEGVNDIGVGVGFVGGISTYFNTLEGFEVGGSGYSFSNSSTPGIRLDWEHGKSEHIGYGVIFCYQGGSSKSTYTQTNVTGYDPNTGFPIYSTATYTDTWSLTWITIAAQVAYHFTASKNFDPYIGATLGYVLATASFSTTNSGSEGLSASAAGIALGAHAGARYLFSDHIGAFAELAYCTNEGENYVNLGISFKF